MLIVIDYGVGNIKNLCNALDHLGATFEVSSNRERILAAERIILPGVGAFEPAMRNLRATCLGDAILEKAASGAPILGICLGMQLLFDVSYENGAWDGLHLIKGEVIKFRDLPKIPHIGWNQVRQVRPSGLFDGIADGSDFYFVHSYVCRPAYSENILATSGYGRDFPCAVRNTNVFGVQFHPEKSQRPGLQLLRNFLKIELPQFFGKAGGK